jgi:hypothetical protein
MRFSSLCIRGGNYIKFIMAFHCAYLIVWSCILVISFCLNCAKVAVSSDCTSWLGQDFPHPSRPALGPTQPPVQWVPGLVSRGKVAGVWHWQPLPQSSIEVEMYLYSLLQAFMASSRVNFIFVPLMVVHLTGIEWLGSLLHIWVLPVNLFTLDMVTK